MSDLDSVAKIRQQFYRLTGSISSDSELVRQGEAVDDVAYQALTEGTRAAQLWMLDNGYHGWRARSSAITWLGTEAANGGRYVALPATYLRLYGDMHPGKSALVEADGTPWGQQIDAGDDRAQGDFYYVRGEELWITRLATPPTTLYIDFHYRHPAWTSGVTIDFPTLARGLLAPKAASIAMEENWLPGDRNMEVKIERAMLKAEARARMVARQTKQPRRMKEPYRAGNAW